MFTKAMQILEKVQHHPESTPVCASLIQLLQVSNDWRDSKGLQLGWRFYKLVKEECTLKQETGSRVENLLMQIQA